LTLPLPAGARLTLPVSPPVPTHTPTLCSRLPSTYVGSSFLIVQPITVSALTAAFCATSIGRSSVACTPSSAAAATLVWRKTKTAERKSATAPRHFKRDIHSP